MKNGRGQNAAPVPVFGDSVGRLALSPSIGGDVLQEGEVPGPLDRNRQLALLACRTMRLPAGEDLAPLVQTHLETLDVLVIDHFVVGEDRLLAAARSPAPARA